ncbi:hypothetical protein JXA63_03000 [Candidatus Woesebacteria bacterium]|nr:hypothetical protein [Candidatus Woesebacteria bacterium]
MLETPHVVVGAAIAASVSNPMLSLPLALGSHFLLDRIPHWNPHTYTETEKYGKIRNSSMIIASVDTAIAFLIGSYIAYTYLPDYKMSFVIITACFLSVLPDVIKSPFYLMKNKNGLLKKYINFERSLQVEIGIYLGLLTQLLVITTGLWWIFG